MKKQRNYKSYRIPSNYSLPRAVLDILLDVSDGITLFDSPYMRAKRSWRRLRGEPEPEPWRYNRAITYLKKRQEIKLIEKNNKTFIKLTKKGKLRALLLRLYRDFGKEKVWDRKWRLILWDIPEASSHARDQIRNIVKGLGFYRLQKSVFITPYPLPKSAVEYLRETKLIDYIRFLRIDKLDDDRFLRRHFGC